MNFSDTLRVQVGVEAADCKSKDKGRRFSCLFFFVTYSEYFAFGYEFCADLLL